MKIKIYNVYFNGEIEKQFLLKRRAKKYTQYLIRNSNIYVDEIYYRRGYIYV